MSHCSCFVISSFMAVLGTMDCLGMLDWLFPNSDVDRLAMLRDLITSTFGAFLGVGLALWTSGLISEKNERRRRRAMLDTIKSNLDSNFEYLGGMTKQIVSGVNQVPTFLADMSSLDSLVPARIELLEPSPLRTLIERCHFELAHVNRRIEILVNIAVSQFGQSEIELSTQDKKAFQTVVRSKTELSEFAETIDKASVVEGETNSSRLTAARLIAAMSTVILISTTRSLCRETIDQINSPASSASS